MVALAGKTIGVLFTLCITGAFAGSGKDYWGLGTLTNLPPGRGRGTVPNQAGDSGVPSPIDLDCQCSDASPRDLGSGLLVDTCFNVRNSGKCNDDFMWYASAELTPENYCQISCDRCNCCQSLENVIKSNGGQRFLQLVNSDSEITSLLQHPGYTATIFVPNDQAVQAAEANLPAGVSVSDIIKYHIVPPYNKTNALWTTPFMSLGVKMDTMNANAGPLTTTKFPLPTNTTWRGGLTNFAVQGTKNNATVLQSDIPACKGYVNIIDSVLIP